LRLSPPKTAVLLSLLLLAAPSLRAVPGGWTLFWSDEFNQADNTPPDPATWGYNTGCGGWGNAEYENYTTSTQNSFITSDAACTDGKCLVINAIDLNTGGGTCGYTSARLTTLGKRSFQYGWIEARLKLPYGQGIWPAFWMMGTDIGTVNWPGCGEIDVMENIGKVAEQGHVYETIHGPGYSGASGIGTSYYLPGGALFKDAYHTFAVNWQANRIDFYVDDILVVSRTPASIPAGTTWVYNAPFFFLLNLAVGGGWPGYPDGTTVFPQEYRVDYVRVYHQATPTPSPTSTETLTPSPTLTQTPTQTGTIQPTLTPEGPPPGGCGPLEVSEAYPNPVTIGTAFHVDLSSDCPRTVSYGVWTPLFRRVAEGTVLVSGTGQALWDARDDRGMPVGNGLYYWVFRDEKKTILRKLLVLR